MNPPIPPPRKHKSIYSGRPQNVLFSKAPRPHSGLKRSELVHTAEVHSSKSRLLSTSDEDIAAGDNALQKKRKKLRKRQNVQIFKEIPGSSKSNEEMGKTSDDSAKTVIISRSGRPSKKPHGERRGSLTETLSEDSDKSSGSNRIRLVPILNSNRKKPSGYATETLSEDEASSNPVKSSIPDNRPRVKLPKTSVNPDKTSHSGMEEPDPNPTTVDHPDRGRDEKVVEEAKETICPVPLPRRKSQKDVMSLNKLNKQFAEDTRSNNTTLLSSSSQSGEISVKNLKPVPIEKVEAYEEIENDRKSITSSGSEAMESDKALNMNSEIQESNDIICITFHGCDAVCANKLGKQPVVRVHTIDIVNSKYKASSIKPGEEISPVSTEPCDNTVLQRDMRVHWETEVYICESVISLATPEVVLFFEIINTDSGCEKCKAWAFLKLVGANGAVNIGRLLRLQLFKPPRLITSSKKNSSLPSCYLWWSKGNFRVNKGTLYLIVRPVHDNGTVLQSRLNSSKTCAENESSSRNSISNNFDQSSEKKSKRIELKPIKWNRYPTQMCKLPNKKVHSLDAGPDGCLCIEYSHSGLLLACPTKQNIILYTFDGEIYLILMGHEGLIYCVKWSRDDKYVMSASADSTVCIWNIDARNPYPEQVLSHPSYVYSCCWLRSDDSLREAAIVATGCFDTDIRIWKPENSKGPIQFLSLHQSRVNSLVVTEAADGGSCRLISGDAEGTVIIWASQNGLFTAERELKLNELSGKVINKLCVHPGGKRILVHTRDNMLRMLDLQTGAIIQWYQGGVNRRLRMDSVLCGCGNKVLACSEDNTICVWETDTGNQLAVYHGLISSSASVPVTAIAFHPREHAMAIVSHSANNYPSLIVVRHNKNENGQSVGLVFMDSVDSTDKMNINTSSNHEEKPATQSINTKPSPKKVDIKELNRRHKDSGGGSGGFLGSLLGLRKRAVNSASSRSSSAKGKKNRGFVIDEDGETAPQENFFSRGGVSLPLQTSVPSIGRETSVMNDSNNKKNLGISSDIRLADIIYQMDRILMTASPNPGS